MQTVTPVSLQHAGYYLHLGQFVEQYARLEFIVKLILFRYAGVSHQTGLAVFSGERHQRIFAKACGNWRNPKRQMAAIGTGAVSAKSR